MTNVETNDFPTPKKPRQQGKVDALTAAIYEVRRRRVLDVIDRRFGGSKKAFAQAIERTAPQVGHMTYPPDHPHHRNIGEDLARWIEVQCDLPPGEIAAPPAEEINALVDLVVINPEGGYTLLEFKKQNRPGGEQEWGLEVPSFSVRVDDRGRWKAPAETLPRAKRVPLPGTSTTALLLAGDEAYLYRVPDATMSPRLRPGELVLVEPHAPVNVEDDVLVTLRGKAPRLARLVSRRHGVTLGTLASAETAWFGEVDVVSVHLVSHVVPMHRVSEL